jgi:hypothetical protein
MLPVGIIEREVPCEKHVEDDPAARLAPLLVKRTLHATRGTMSTRHARTRIDRLDLAKTG